MCVYVYMHIPLHTHSSFISFFGGGGRVLLTDRSSTSPGPGREQVLGLGFRGLGFRGPWITQE